ncbi:MAG: DUF2520 domain-containing protein, partial [Bacteroidales bacterium]|nr:DUF2520 domain-containing protein [Bacteroidales bacterium]
GLLEKQRINTGILHPLILETALKIQQMHPTKAQTGPAVRNDEAVMRSHLELLAKENEDWGGIYRMMSSFISEE